MSLDTIQKCYATPSAGMHPSHTLPMKLRAVAAAGFSLAEISFSELEAYAKAELKKEGHEYRSMDSRGRGDVDKLVQATNSIRGLCEELGLKVMAVHPFTKFEGQKDPEKRAAGFGRARTLFKVLKALDCQTMQVGSSNDNDNDITDSFDAIADDFRELADEAAKQDPPIRIAYEMWSWGTYVNTWRHTWAVCERVRRDNFGLCFDTFQICGMSIRNCVSMPSLTYVCKSPSGVSSHADRFKSSLEALTKTVPPSKIFYMQISDGARVDHTQLEKDAADKGLRPLYMWSSKYRPLPYARKEWRGYLPVVDVIEAVVRTGWRGPWSYEVFFVEDQARDDASVPERWTREAMECHGKILNELRRRGL